MSVFARQLFALDDSFARELDGLYVPWQGAAVAAPRLLALNEALAEELGADVAALRADDGVAVLAGSVAPEGATPIAQAYSGHQFGAYSPRLGDGRALLLGEVVDEHGRRRDIHLKGSGRTPFARGGDGKAVVGPMLREYVLGEAMHALGIPTSRALAVVATDERVMRDRPLPGAVLARVAASHIRVGTFQYASINGGRELVRRLADYTLRRHYPDATSYLNFYERVVDAQASLIAQWMLVGFIHGVMNTDNMAISGETIDYGPCAFMDAFDPATVYSSIDYGGRYAFGNQPHIAPWNLARLAEALLPVIDDDQDAAVAAVTEVLKTFPERFNAYWSAGMRAKLGLTEAGDVSDALIDELLRLLHEHRIDFTSTFRDLAGYLRGDALPAPQLADWLERWREQLGDGAADAMDRVNPIYIPRNHLVEEALEAATGGDLEPFIRLVDVLSDPYTERPGLDAYAAPAPESFGPYVTFCGT
jgi:serine/tyrosine/threonine adenylyltransferase